MFKKLTLMALSVAALVAFAVPAAAQAEGPLITNSSGEAAETVEATSSNTISTTSSGVKLECTTVNLHLELPENANTTAKGSGTGTAVGNPGGPTHVGTCRTSSGLGVDITAVNVSEIHLTKHSGVTTGTAKFSYTYDLYAGSMLVAECTFGGSATVKATGTSSLNISGTLTKTGGSASCPTEGTIAGDFALDDEFGGVAHID
ncbi:MAG TPA: hypothetical protein VFS54_02440 [Solirubrobacterales bacterium]|nr:hypothetical protein [Solirubrobacterales bacterium]